MRIEHNLSTGEVLEFPDYIPYQETKTFESIVEDFEQAIQQELDADAQAKGYDNILSACAYAGAPNPFQAEAISFVTWRGNVWAYCYQELDKVQAGARPMPTVEKIISELPVRVSQ